MCNENLVQQLQTSAVTVRKQTHKSITNRDVTANTKLESHRR